MKKLLLLFISFAFIGASNANSIKGAFGYELGAFDNSIETNMKFLGDWYFTAKKVFTPNKPAPFFDDYYVLATPESKKIYQIMSRKSIWSGEWTDNPNEKCFPVGTHFSNLLGMLEAKYGAFKLYDEWREGVTFGKDSDGNPWSAHKYSYKFIDGDRGIYLRCNHDDIIKKYYLTLQYIDNSLEKIQDLEVAELRRKQALKESSDYDL